VRIGLTAEQYLESVRKLPGESLAILDPPRAGLSPRLRSLLLDWSPRHVVGLSCDPSTWARDTHELLQGGYELSHLELFDLFPSTHHVEVVYRLELP
jgi:tRNA/tmRNA/rRNA uracil-C5-methylase (TrmA/RlmC/RlmD family)